MSLFRLVWLLVAISLAGCASRKDLPWNPGPASAKLVELMGERLVLAQDIAWAKYKAGLPVADRKRESSSMKALVGRGRALGLSPQRVRAFFSAQFAASRSVQSDLMTRWKTGGTLPARAPRDLERELRSRMDAINDALLLQLAGAGASGRGRELARRAELYLLALDLPQEAVLKAVRPLR